MEALAWLKDNWKDILDVLAYIVMIASVIVRMTPTLKDDAILLPIIKFISKYIALNTPTPEERPK